MVKTIVELFSWFASMVPIVLLQQWQKILTSLSPFHQVLLFVGYIFLMILLASYSSSNRQKWYATATSLLCLVLGKHFFRGLKHCLEVCVCVAL